MVIVREELSSLGLRGLVLRNGIRFVDVLLFIVQCIRYNHRSKQCKTAAVRGLGSRNHSEQRLMGINKAPNAERHFCGGRIR